jgi:mono/diheme cytochrome c family protein
MKRANAHEFKTEEEAEEGLTKAFYYDSILHHGRPGFLWQKLRQPRSYDYEKIETKRYDERLRMPRFPLSSEQVEAVATFVLGLTAEPPAPKYVFSPKGPTLARYEGETLLHKYNCTSCHMVELPEVLQVVMPRQPKEDTVSWLLENRDKLADGSLPRSDYETYYRQLDDQLQKHAGLNVQALAEQANAEASSEEGYEAYLNKWFDQHPKTLSATYADYSNISMTLDQIIGWFVENREGLLDGSLSDYPEDITKIQELCELFNLGTDVRGIAKLANVTDDSTGRKLAPEESEQRYQGNLKSWFDNHPETLLVDVDTLKNPKQGKLPAGVRALFKVKPPQSGETNRLSDNGNPVLRFHGMGLYIEELEGYSYDLWDTLSVGGRIMLPTSKMLFSPEEVVELNPGRGGVFTEWLVERLAAGQFDKISKARQSSPPPLVLEGRKVQTPWLYDFLKNPERLRHETVLRMPRFNMSDAEARALANYFAAVEEAEYPYQDIPQRKPSYIAAENREYHEKFPEDAKEQPEYLNRSWKLLGKFAACRQCHSIAGDEFKVLDPKQVTHGPDLNTRVANRLRPEFLDAWLQSPQWILPYSAMVGPTSAPLEGYFNQNSDAQVEAIRDAMLNFNQLLESQGKIEPPPPTALPPVAGAGQE